MTVVTYRGDVEELQGQQFDVPATVMKAGQAGAWIESTWREEQARQSAAAEAERRQQELLAARLDEQRRAAGAAAAEADAIQTRSELEAGLRDELADLSQSVMAAGGAIVGKAELIEAQTRDWEARHEAMVATSEERLATVEERELQMLAKVELAVDQAELGEQQREERFAESQADLRKQVLSQVGPQGVTGERGMAGAGFAYVDTDPTRIDPGSLGKRYFGRPVVPGDMLLQRTADSLKVWRTSDGKSWKVVDEIVNRQELVSQPLSILDQSTRVIAPTLSGGSGGGLGIDEHLVSNRVNAGASVIVADCSNWANLATADQITSGVLDICLKPFNGSLMGRSLRTDIPFTWESGGGQFTVDGDLGSLSTFVDVSISLQRRTALPAPGFSGVMPPATITQVFLQVTPKVGGGGFGTTTQFRVAGDMAWDFESAGVVVQAGQPLPQPLWYWT